MSTLGRSLKRTAALLSNVAFVLAGGLSFVVPALPWMSGLAQYAILIAIFAAWIGARYIAGAEASQGRTEIEVRIARNRKYWDEFDRLMPDPLFRGGIEVWVPPSLASSDDRDGPQYSGKGR
jgi:hypothetical protein